MAKAPASAPLAGIALFLAGLLLAALQVALSKVLTAELPVLLVVWGRYLVSLLLVLPAALVLHGAGAFALARPGLQLVRGALMALSTLLFIAAVSGAPIAEMTAIIFVYPFVMMAFAPWLLGERNRRSSWIAIVAGFVGVLIVMRPGTGTFGTYGLVALTAGFFMGAYLVITRRIGESSPPLVTVTCTAAVGVVLLSLPLPFAWQTIGWTQIALLLAIGIVATLCQLFLILACTGTDMGTLAPFSFCEILFAATMGFLFFGEFPDAMAWAGIMILAGSGLYVAVIQSGERMQQGRRRSSM
ncbi:MAG: DMT family transporter [Xanthobacteraceae bacterium]